MNICKWIRNIPLSISGMVMLVLSLTMLAIAADAQQNANRRGISAGRIDDVPITNATSHVKALASVQSSAVARRTVAASEDDARYKAVQIGVLPGYTNSEIDNDVNMINNSGHVAGFSWLYNGVPNDDDNNVYLSAHPFLWRDGKLTALPLPKCASAAYATGINDRDQVIAETNEVNSSGVRVRRAFMVDHGKVFVLQALDADSNTQPFAINLWGSVVGHNRNRTTGQNTPVAWSGGKIYALPLLPGQAGGIAFGINDLGVIAGYQFTTGDASEVACLWYWNGSAYAVIALQTLGGNFGDAYGINNWGQAVGNATDAGDVDFFGMLWDFRGPHSLPMLPGDTDGLANAINDFGQITGFTFGVDQFGNDYQRVVLWQRGSVTDLQTVVPASTPTLTSIGNANLSGQIAVETGTYVDGSDAAYVLVPKDN